MIDQWFKVKVVYPVTKRPNGLELDSDPEDRDPVLERAGHYGDLADDYEIENAYFNLVSDPIMHLMAGSFKPNDKINKRNYTLIVFESGNTVTAIGKPDDVFEQLIRFMESFTKDVKD